VPDETRPLYIERPEPGRLALVGELDVHTARMLDDALEPMDGASLTIDLSRLAFVDSSGLRAMVRARRNHHGVMFVRPTPGLVRLLEISGLTDTLLLSGADDEPDAEPAPAS
jgi:anti-anti-sigma factor